MLRLIEKQIEDLNALIAKAINDNVQMKAKAARMKELKYVGDVTVSTLHAFMPELGTLTDRQAAALTGVAPMNRDSGGMRGHRFITAGRGKVLYMIAMGLSKHNAFMKVRYDRLKANGKPTKVAFVAIVRHLIILINRMIKNRNSSCKQYRSLQMNVHSRRA
jgi:transposase